MFRISNIIRTFEQIQQTLNINTNHRLSKVLEFRLDFQMKAVYIVFGKQKQTYSNEREVHMNKNDVAMLGFEIVAYSGEARSKYLNALKIVKAKGDATEVQKLVGEAEESLKLAHNAQTAMLAKEASGDDIELGFIFVHGQDHLMTTILLKDILENLMDIYK